LGERGGTWQEILEENLEIKYSERDTWKLVGIGPLSPTGHRQIRQTTNRNRVVRGSIQGQIGNGLWGGNDGYKLPKGGDLTPATGPY